MTELSEGAKKIAIKFFKAERTANRATRISTEVAAELSHIANMAAALSIAQLDADLAANDLDNFLVGKHEDIKHHAVNLSTKVAEDLSAILNAIADLAATLAAINVRSSVDIKMTNEMMNGEKPQTSEPTEP
jgi:hypothetical protein